MLLVTTIVEIYYNVILSWGLFYMLAAFPSIPWRQCDTNSSSYKCGNDYDPPTDYFLHNALGQVEEKSGDEFYSLINMGGLKWDNVFCYFIAWMVVCMSLIRGVKSSGKVVYFTALFPYFVLTILLIIVVQLNGAGEGIRQYLEPDPKHLYDPKVNICPVNT